MEIWFIVAWVSIMFIGIGIFIYLNSCKHDYDIVHEFEMESEFDMVINCKRSIELSDSHALSFKRKKVTDYKCKRCGKIKRFESVTG